METNLGKLCKASKWNGGTIHQVASELFSKYGLHFSTSEILKADELEINKIISHINSETPYSEEGK